MDNCYLNISHTTANWINPDKNTYTNLKKLHIWRIKTINFISELKDFKLILEAAEIERFLKYKTETDRQTRIICRAVLRTLLGRYLTIDPKKIQFKLDHQKKPNLKSIDDENLHFNVSHSGDWILIAVSENPVGIDLEKINASFIYQNLLDFSFNADEQNDIQTSNFSHYNFYRLWTRKEALLKATGKGLIDELAFIPSLNGNHQNPIQLTGSVKSWHIKSFNIDENHVASTAFTPVKTVLKFFNFQL